MANRERRIERGEWLMRRDLEEMGADLRNARLGAGLSLQEVGRKVGIVPSVILGHERAELPGPRPGVLARHAAAVGMRARIKVYPEGEPLRDAAQVALIHRFRDRLPVGHLLQLEVPVSDEPRDMRAWDALLALPGCRCALEFVTRFHDCQAQLRHFQLKLRDGSVDRLILVVMATHANRSAIAAAADVIDATFPLGTRPVIAALAAGRDPGANGLMFL